MSSPFSPFSPSFLLTSLLLFYFLLLFFLHSRLTPDNQNDAGSRPQSGAPGAPQTNSHPLDELYLHDRRGSFPTPGDRRGPPYLGKRRGIPSLAKRFSSRDRRDFPSVVKSGSADRQTTDRRESPSVDKPASPSADKQLLRPPLYRHALSVDRRASLSIERPAFASSVDRPASPSVDRPASPSVDRPASPPPVDKPALRRMLQISVSILEKNGIPVWLDYGTLLGSWRHGDILKSQITDDVDLGVRLHDYASVQRLWLRHLPSDLRLCSFVSGVPGHRVVDRVNVTTTLRIKIVPTSANLFSSDDFKTCATLGPALDVFPYSRCAEDLLCRADMGFMPAYHGWGRNYEPVPEEWIFPLGMHRWKPFPSFSSVNLPVPGRTQDYLTFRYGCLGEPGIACRPHPRLPRFWRGIDHNSAGNDPSRPLTLVTGLWDLNSDHRIHDRDFNRTFASYEAWFAHNLAEIRLPVVVFVPTRRMEKAVLSHRGCGAEDSGGSFRDSSGSFRDSSGSFRDSSGSFRDSSGSIRESNSSFSLCSNTIVFRVSLDALLSATLNPWTQPLVELTSLLRRDTRLRRSRYARPERPHLVSAAQQSVYLGKVNLVRRVAELNPFGSEFVGWIDAGYAHGEHVWGGGRGGGGEGGESPPKTATPATPATLARIPLHRLRQFTRGGQITMGGASTLDAIVPPPPARVCSPEGLAQTFEGHWKMYTPNFMLAEREKWVNVVGPTFYRHLEATLNRGMLDDDMAIWISVACEDPSFINVPCLQGIKGQQWTCVFERVMALADER